MVRPRWLSLPKKRSSHRDTDALLAVLQSKAHTSPCLPCTKAWEGSGAVCWWELGSHGLLQTFWGKGSCFAPCRDDTYAPSPREHQDCGLTLLTGYGGPVSALEAPGAWIEPVGLLSFPFSLVSEGGSWHSAVTISVDMVHLVIVTSH